MIFSSVKLSARCGRYQEIIIYMKKKKEKIYSMMKIMLRIKLVGGVVKFL